MKKPINFLQIAAIFGFLTVALGAFGAHGLKAHLSSDSLAIWQTAVNYQAIHTLVLLAVGILQQVTPAKGWQSSGWGFTLGCLLFSGSLYALAMGAPKAIGMVTPLGGLCFLWGWLQLGLAARQHPIKNS